jgi:ribosome maturation factor RimP
MVDVAARVERLLSGALEAEGYELMHVEYLPRGAASVLRLYIDKPGGVTLDDCQKASRYAGVLLDVEDVIPHHYVLEVSSPGIERPLFREADYRRFLGKEIHLTTRAKIEERKNFTGVIRAVASDVLTLECDGRTYLVPLKQIRRANLVYHFE